MLYGERWMNASCLGLVGHRRFSDSQESGGPCASIFLPPTHMIIIIKYMPFFSDHLAWGCERGWPWTRKSKVLAKRTEVDGVDCCCVTLDYSTRPNDRGLTAARLPAN
jgi:hypothetical protein